MVITGLTRNFVVILELSASHPLIYKGFPQFKYNFIRRGIEAVITGLTRKKLGFVTISALESLVNSHFFGILSEYFMKAGRQFSIKIP